jgi:hypothetical protein
MNYLFFFIMSFALTVGLSGVEYKGPTDLTLKVFDTLTIHGPAQLKLIKAKILDVKGPLEFSQLDISGSATLTGTVKGAKGKFKILKVTGPIEVDHVVCEELFVIGSVKAQFLDVAIKANITGELEVLQSKFKDLIVDGDKIVLDSVQLDSMTVKKGKTNETVTLRGNTVVNGDILFESGNGLVNVESTDVQIKGAIKGGTRK